MDELARVGAAAVNAAFGGFDDLVAPYLADLGTDEQKRRWLPGLCSGELRSAIAMTEPEAGSDLSGIRTTAVSQGGHWVLTGSKTFITGGAHANVVVTVARTGEREFSAVRTCPSCSSTTYAYRRRTCWAPKAPDSGT